MLRRIGAVIFLLALPGVTATCGDDRSRPTEPMSQDEEPRSAPGPPQESRTPLVEIVDPVDGSGIARDSLTSEAGLPVRLEGRFVPGQEIELEALATQFGPLPVHQLSYVVEEVAFSQTHRISANVLHVIDSSDFKIFVRVREQQEVLSVDSVVLELK